MATLPWRYNFHRKSTTISLVTKSRQRNVLFAKCFVTNKSLIGVWTLVSTLTVQPRRSMLLLGVCVFTNNLSAATCSRHCCLDSHILLREGICIPNARRTEQPDSKCSHDLLLQPHSRQIHLLSSKLLPLPRDLATKTKSSVELRYLTDTSGQAVTAYFSAGKLVLSLN